MTTQVEPVEFIDPLELVDAARRRVHTAWG